MGSNTLELLSPATNADIAIQAITHGADAIYIGATSHGARKSAANSIEDIAKVVDFAHQYRAKVYVTVNTIVYEHELKQVEKLCLDLYKNGVDALIVQDMALLRLDLPPIPLHASTQCDIRTPEKALFLQEAGFSQIVLARELTIPEIKAIVDTVNIPVECFVHGALCVGYSGRCHASFATSGRSANRGECAQICRLPYTLKDHSGKILAKDKYLLSLRDFNASDHLQELVDAGVRSFKIEGRLKEMDYVKNITAFYNLKLNEIISMNPESLSRSSFGKSVPLFTPCPEKSFNRGFTEYFLSDRRPANIASMLSPKSMGEFINEVSDLHNGDGISYFDRNGQYQGVNVNRIEKGKIITGRKVDIPKGAQIHRTFDLHWQKMMQKESAVRKIGLDIEIDNSGVTAKDQRGVMVRIPLDIHTEIAKNRMDYKNEFSKLGNTIYTLSSYKSTLSHDVFIPKSAIGVIRRKIVEALDISNKITYPIDLRRKENMAFPFPARAIDFKDNVANSLATQVYRDHGVSNIGQALECGKTSLTYGTTLMTTRHCILRELGMCKKVNPKKFQEPLTISNSSVSFTLEFDCKNCEMQLLSHARKNIPNGAKHKFR